MNRPDFSPPPPPRAARLPSAANNVGIPAPSIARESLIGPDLKISGQGLRIAAAGKLEIEGEVEGDVIASELAIGRAGLVVGTVSAEHVLVSGRVQGTIRAKSVVLRETSVVEGDIQSAQLTLDAGSQFDGRASRQLDLPALEAELATTRRAE